MARRIREQTKKYSLPDQVKVNTPEKEKKFKQKKFREKTEALGGKVKYMDEFRSGGRVNTRRMNRLEELGRVDAEKAFTKKGARNLRDEKKRIVRELKAKGGLMEPKEHKKRRKEKKERAKDPATGKAIRKGGLQSSYGKGRNPMKRERLKEAFAPGKKLVLRSERIEKAKGGSVPEKKIRKAFPKMTAKQRARLQTRLGDRTAPMKKERLKKADGGSLKKVQPHQKGLKKLPTKVRNKMGYMKKGGRVGMGKALRGGGCVR